jgi:probable phosphoglycerate mutase
MFLARDPLADRVNKLTHSLDFKRLDNSYYALRHGHSLANEQGVIVSKPENGCAGYGLSEQGRAQILHSLQSAEDLDANTIILSSDFKRARESAEIAHEMLACSAPVSLDTGLRERFFGTFELASDKHYAEVWREDASDPDSQAMGVESVNQVMQRVTSVIARCEARYSNSTILLISHGDALQILQTAFAGRDGSTHRQLEHLRTAEIRKLRKL